MLGNASCNKINSKSRKKNGWIEKQKNCNLILFCILFDKTGVHMVGGVSYEKFDDEGLHTTVDGVSRVLKVDNVIVCAGQEPLKDLEVRWF